MLLAVESFVLRNLSAYLAACFETADGSDAVHSYLVELVLWILYVLHALSRVEVASLVRAYRLARNYPDLVLVGDHNHMRRRHIPSVRLASCFPHATYVI